MSYIIKTSNLPSNSVYSIKNNIILIDDWIFKDLEDCPKGLNSVKWFQFAYLVDNDMFNDDVNEALGNVGISQTINDTNYFYGKGSI